MAPSYLIKALVPIVSVIVVSCSPGQESSSTGDTLAAATTTVAVDSSTAVMVVHNLLFEDPVAADLTKENPLQKWFPDGEQYSGGVDMTDGTPWFQCYEFTSEGLTISYCDHFQNAEPRFYFRVINSTDPTFELGNGLRVGTSKDEFMKVLQLTDPKAAVSNNIVIMQQPGKHRANFSFKNGKINRIGMSFDYGENEPKRISTLFSEWTEIMEIPDEGEPERTLPCRPGSYTISVVSGPKQTGEDPRYVLIKGDNEQRDEIEWIRKSDEGFVIRAMNSINSTPYTVNIVLRDNDPSWTSAEWDSTVYVHSDQTGGLRKQPCDN